MRGSTRISAAGLGPADQQRNAAQQQLVGNQAAGQRSHSCSPASVEAESAQKRLAKAISMRARPTISG